MPLIKDIDNPSFIRYPYHTDRTAYRPFGLPMICVVPHVRDINNVQVADSEITHVKIYIADVTAKSPVAGHDHVGIFKPDVELFVRDISANELLAHKITAITVVDGKFTYTSRTGTTDTIPFISHADYYDLSDILIETETLPVGKYQLIYEAQFNPRIVSDVDQVICFDTDHPALAQHKFIINHPGEVLLQMSDMTPSQYFTDAKRSEDTTVEFYRPFTEILQDIYDEQNFLQKINWVYDTAPQFIPYLGYLLGWDIPYYPKSVDSLRRVILLNTVRLQKLKGTKRALRELFDLFGFIIKISNVWWTPDGKYFTAPNELTPEADQRITKTRTATTEPLIAAYNVPGFGEFAVPLLNRPTVKPIINAFLIKNDTAASEAADAITTALESNLTAYDTPLGDFQSPTTPTTIDNLKLMDGINGYVRLDAVILESSGISPLSLKGIAFNSDTNIINVVFTQNFAFADEKLYIFATYEYDKLDIPADMIDLQSNRFDIEILTKDGSDVKPDVVVFLLNFIFKLKAFHSLLRKLLYSVTNNEVYLVTDACAGGNITQRPDVGLGKQQVPPEAVIPSTPTPCNIVDPTTFGYRRQDINYRDAVISGLKEEFEAWKALGENCEFNYKGQDRTTQASEQTSNTTDAVTTDSDAPRSTLCELDGSDYCYKGRVTDQIISQPVIPLSEIWQFSQCPLSLGYGFYYLYKSIVGKSTSLLGRLLRDYASNCVNDCLHYSDKPGLDDEILPSRHLGIRRPSLNIQKDNLGFPGHRLPLMRNLLTDYISSDYNMRPWDAIIECGCPTTFPDPLNAELVIGSDGDEYIEFDTAPYTIVGNGLTPDIDSLGSQSDSSAVPSDHVTHKIYYSGIGGNPAVTLDNYVEQIGVINVDEGIFDTAVECESNLVDYSDGYPAETGFLDVSSVEELDFPSLDASSNDELRAGLGMPAFVTPSTLLFTLSSEIRVDENDILFQFYKGYRLNCKCARLECGSGSDTNAIDACSISDFLTKYHNTDPDQIEVESKVVLEEFQCVESDLLDGTATLFDLKQILTSNGYKVDENGGPGPTAFPPDGSFTFKDDYGIIYELRWETIGQYFDFILITKQPRVWGVSDGARTIRGRELYNTGIVSIIRRIYLIIDDGYELLAEGTQESIEEFKSTYLCNAPFIDPFILHLCHNIVDELDVVVIGSSGS